MKKLLLTGIAALFLAIGTAHAGRYNDWKCGDNITLSTSIEKVNPPDSHPVTYTHTLLKDCAPRTCE
jgi:hypothetical protein